MFEDIIGQGIPRSTTMDLKKIACPKCVSWDLAQIGPAERTGYIKGEYLVAKIECNACKATFFALWTTDYNNVHIDVEGKIVTFIKDGRKV